MKKTEKEQLIETIKKDIKNGTFKVNINQVANNILKNKDTIELLLMKK